MIKTKYDAVDRFSFFENLSKIGSKQPSTGVFFSGCFAYCMDDNACGKIIVRDGNRDGTLFYDFKTGETLPLDTAMLPRFPAHCENFFFLQRRKLSAYIKGLGIAKRKMATSTAVISRDKNDKVIVTLYTKKGEILGEFSQNLYLISSKKSGIALIPGHFCKMNLLYFSEIIAQSFKEYDIIGVRFDEKDEVCLFGKNPKKPNITWKLTTYK